MLYSEKNAFQVNVLLKSLLLEIDECKYDWNEVGVSVVMNARLASRLFDIAVV